VTRPESGDSLTARTVFDSAVIRRMIQGMPARRLWPGFLAILLLLCIGVGLVSAALPDDEAEDSGYYDGDGDDAVATPQRLAILIDVAVSARAGTVSVRTSEVFDVQAVPVSTPTAGRSQPPLLRSPPFA
jgi:hypothetical protein